MSASQHDFREACGQIARQHVSACLGMSRHFSSSARPTPIHDHLETTLRSGTGEIDADYGRVILSAHHGTCGDKEFCL
jgi:hypothetical protein